MAADDPFRHHPELRGRIAPAEQSFFRDLDLAELDARVIAAGRPPDWRTPCEQREAGRKAFLGGRMDRDLWVFAYGSLMWDPGIVFAEVRRARSTGYARSFCLWDTGGRGSVDRPGLMLAIDEGPDCTGLAFRIERARLDHETFVLWRREMIMDAYRPVLLSAETAQGPVEAVGFAANRGNGRVVPGIPLEDQAGMIAVAEGLLGSNWDYLDDVAAHLRLLGVRDPYISDLHTRAQTLR